VLSSSPTWKCPSTWRGQSTTCTSPEHEEFQPPTLWSLSNALTSAFKQLEPIPQFRATAKLAGFLYRQ
jgi:hypothetical protein